MRIAMLLHRSLEHDSRVRREVSALTSAGYRVTILELGPTGHLPGFDRMRVRRGGQGERRGLLLRAYQLGFLLSFFVAAVRRRPDVVHAHDVAMLLPGLAAARITGARLVYDSHELASGVAYRRGLLAWSVTAIERVCIRRAAAVVTVSDSIADRLQELYGLGRRPVVVRNFCALPRPRADEPDGGLRGRTGLASEPLILHQGAAAPERGCKSLVRAMVALPGAQLVFLGNPEAGFGSELTGLATELGVAERVHFVPSVPVEELLAHTREADIGVSLFESTCECYRLTLPNKLFEYVAAGVPVVGSAQPEVERLILEHGIGWTVDAGDADQVATVLRMALEGSRDPRLLARLRAADASFSWAREQRRLLDAYRLVGSA